jgi:hypothetical protein
MIEIRGKRGPKVSVILTNDTKQAMEALVSTREKVGISAENDYFFAQPSPSKTYIRGWECLAKYAKRSGLEKPELVTSTRLRKYIATVSQVLDLNENEMGWLARHMGHDINIHREYYRLQESTIELAKISKLLTAVDKGDLREFQGKSIDDLEIELEGKCEICHILYPLPTHEAANSK